jgi:hypothetical protein
VKLAPFDDRRKASFESVVEIARQALRAPSTKTPAELILRMPARSIFLSDTKFRVVPSYGAEQIESLIVEFQEDSRYEVGRAGTILAGMIGTTLHDHAPACLAIVEKQLKFESERSNAEGIEQSVVESRLRPIRNTIEALGSIMNHGWEPASIPDTEYHALLTSSREELLLLVCDGHWAALSILQDAPPNAEEREKLLAAASNDPSSAGAGGILGALCYPIAPDRPRDQELQRIDQLIAWFERELQPVDLHRRQQQEYAKMLFSLAGRPPRNAASATPDLLDLKRGQAVIDLLERFLLQPESKDYVADFISRLKSVYTAEGKGDK